MNGRRSFDSTTAKPFNINIYYNINSKNITNNHQVQSHPVTARINKTMLQADHIIPEKNQIRSKPIKIQKKKYSVDLSIPTDRKTEKIGKKSNNVSICSGFPSQANYKKEKEKQTADKKASHPKKFEKSEKKLNQLLQIFSEGKIDKAKLTKEIMEIFQYKGSEQGKQKKAPKKKRSQSTLIGTVTPKNNQMHRLNSVNANNMKTVMNIHNVRKKQSKSQKSHFSNQNKQMIRSDIVRQIIQQRAINSSLFLQPDDDQKIGSISMGKINDVQTSQSIILLKENLKKEKQKFQKILNKQKEKSLQEEMAIKIQRAWRKYKTKILILQVMKPKPQVLPTDPNSYLQKIQCISAKSDMNVQHFLSQEIGRKNAIIKQSEIEKVEQLRDHQLKKWNQIMDYVKISINNKSLSSGQCLMQIIDYFQNAKQAVEKQLQFEFAKKQGKQKQAVQRSRQSRQMTQFTNKVFSREIQNGENHSQNIDSFKQQAKQQQNDDINCQQQEQQSQQNNQENQEQQINEENFNLEQSQNSQSNQRIRLHDDFQMMLNKKSDNLSFQIVQAALIKYSKKLDTQHDEKIKKIDINSSNYLQTKKKLQQKFKQSKRQLKRIISNLNKGYLEAKVILQKEAFLSSEESLKNSNSSNDKEKLQKCKSDNYLLKTAINYKKYIEKKQQHKNKKTLINSNQSQENEKVLTKVKNRDNLQLKSAGSSQLSDASMVKRLKQVMDPQENEEQTLIGNKSDPFEIKQLQDGEGCISNIKQTKFNRLQQKIVSQQFLQYEQIHKKFDEDDQKQSNSIVSHENKVSAEQISLFQNTKLNEINKKLKYLTSQDKDDIFEFLFIDLTLQLITEYDQDTNVYKTIKKYVDKRKRLESIPKGVKTNLQSCKQYLNLLSKTIAADFSEMFLKHIAVPMGPTAKEMLKYMHDQDYNQEFSQNQDLNVPLILPVTIFQRVQSKSLISYPRYYDDDAKEIPRIKFLKSIDHIHHKALFDGLNQCLDSQRPYGIYGVPFPWKTTHKNRRNFDWEGKTKINKLQRGVQKVTQCCSYMCGILSDKQDNVFNNHKVSEHYVQQIRQDRMSKMLANQLLENQQRWSFYDDEETEVIIELSRAFYLFLVDQFARQFTYIATKKSI